VVEGEVQATAEGSRMSDDPPDSYLRYAAHLARQGLPVTLSAEPEDGNVVSIAAARTRRATEQMMRGRATRERPL
jgi:hypothetical protein